jgi:hypothetical protein
MSTPDSTSISTAIPIARADVAAWPAKAGDEAELDRIRTCFIGMPVVAAFAASAARVLVAVLPGACGPWTSPLNASAGLSGLSSHHARGWPELLGWIQGP